MKMDTYGNGPAKGVCLLETVKCLRKKHRKSYVPGHKVSSLTFTSTVTSFSKEKIFLPFRTKKSVMVCALEKFGNNRMYGSF